MHLDSDRGAISWRCGNVNHNVFFTFGNRNVLEDQIADAIDFGVSRILLIHGEGAAGKGSILDHRQIDGRPTDTRGNVHYDIGSGLGGFSLRQYELAQLGHSLFQNLGDSLLGGFRDKLLSSFGDKLLSGLGGSLLGGFGDGLLGGFGDGLLGGLWDGLLGGFGDGHLCGLVIRRDAFCRFQQGGGFVRFFRQCLERHHGHNHCHGQQKGQQSLFHAWFLLFMEIDSVSLGQWGNRVAGYSFQQLKYKICPQQIQQQIVTFTT